MKIAIIGCGYVGTALARQLKKNGHYVTVTTRSPSKASSLYPISDEVYVLQGNDCETMTELLRQQEAVILSVAADSQTSYESTYLETAKTLSKSIVNTPQLSQIIYTGSTSVYGDHQGQTVDEETLPLNSQMTGEILLSTENILLSLSSKKRKVCILRLGEIYGPQREIVDRLRQMKGEPLPGDGSSITNLIHLNAIINGIEFSLQKNLNGIFNLCNDIHLPRKKFYDEICAQANLEPVRWNPNKVGRHSGNKLVSNAKIKLAGFKSIDEGTFPTFF